MVTPFTQSLMTETLVSSCSLPLDFPSYSFHYQRLPILPPKYIPNTSFHLSLTAITLVQLSLSFRFKWYLFIFPILSILYRAARLAFKCRSNQAIPLLKRKTNKRHIGCKGRNKTVYSQKT